MRKVAVFGANGNMGKRYCLILERYCNCEVLRLDYGNPVKFADLNSCDGFIIATPTNTHIELIKFLIPYKKPILCEKPITKYLMELKTLISIEGLDLSMINQYEFLDYNLAKGHTSYNYFKTGNDGLLWDCINIIGTARSSYDVSNTSLIWKCQLNGETLDLSAMDQAYIDNITAWVNGWRNKDYILPAHEKVSRRVTDDQES